MGSVYQDDKRASTNMNKGGVASYARVDKACWGAAESHEIMHMLGGVQPSAPHATSGSHCNDSDDTMCCNDGTFGLDPAHRLRLRQSLLLDCRHDDYFSTAPAESSYLYSHWKSATSGFLSASLTGPPPPAPSSRPSPAAQQTPPPAPTSSPSPSSSPTQTSLIPGLPVLTPSA